MYSPQAKVVLPDPPDKLDIKTVPLSSKTVIQPSKGKEFTVPQGGGAYMSKSSLETYRYQHKLWDYYAEGVEKAKAAYNALVDKNNEKIVAPAKSTEKSSWLGRIF